MGRKSLNKNRKPITKNVKKWLEDLLLNLQDKDLEKLTIDDLALLAGKSKSTIYMYFESKEEILLAACKIRIDELAKKVTQTLEQNLDTLIRYKCLVQLFAEGTSGISLSFLQSIKQNYYSSWIIIEDFTNLYIEVLKQHYNIGITEGVFNNINIELTSQIDKIFVMQVVTDSDLFNDETYTVSQLIKDYLNLRLTGLLKQ